MRFSKLGSFGGFGATALAVCFAVGALAEGSAHAQYYAPPPPPPPPGYGGGYYPQQLSPQPPPAPIGTYRSGLIFGGTLGLGSFKLSSEFGDSSDMSGIGGTLHVGGMITPTFAILIDGWAVINVKDQTTASLSMGVVAARWFISDSFWIEGGLGLGSFSIDEGSRKTGTSDAVICHDGCPSGSSSSESGGALMLAAGFELWHTGNFALDVNGRFGVVDVGTDGDGQTITGTMGMLALGLNWY